MWYDLCISYVFNIFYDISTVIIITLNTMPIIIIVVVIQLILAVTQIIS